MRMGRREIEDARLIARLNAGASQFRRKSNLISPADRLRGALGGDALGSRLSLSPEAKATTAKGTPTLKRFMPKFNNDAKKRWWWCWCWWVRGFEDGPM